MKLLRVCAQNFRNCSDDLTLDFVAKSKKTSEDKEYELQEIAENLYTFNTAAFIGKNASGKTTAIELLDYCYSILGDFRLSDRHYDRHNIKLDIIFYHSGYLYRYITGIYPDEKLIDKMNFHDQHLYRKPYHKSNAGEIYNNNSFVEITNLGDLPEDTSSVFFVLKRKSTLAVYFDSNGRGIDTYQFLFKTMKMYGITGQMLAKIIGIFDENLSSLEMIDEYNYRMIYQGKTMMISDKELLHFLSSGTTKGILLYTMVVASLQNGFDLLIDEIENHFHKTLVENLISLYKDKNVNKRNATLLFTTHYCELLDLFNRQDNIWVCRSDEKIHIQNMYESYPMRSSLLKSKQFYNNAFQTSVNYEKLMEFKKELMR